MVKQKKRAKNLARHLKPQQKTLKAVSDSKYQLARNMNQFQ